MFIYQIDVTLTVGDNAPETFTLNLAAEDNQDAARQTQEAIAERCGGTLPTNGSAIVNATIIDTLD